MFYKNLLNRFPPSAQNIFFSLGDLVAHQKRFSPSFYKLLGELKSSEWMSSAEINEFKNEQFLRIVRHAYDTVPFYRELYDRYGVNLRSIHGLHDIAYLPVISKADVFSAGKSILSSKYNLKSPNLLVGLTSGSTGTPLRVYKTHYSQSYQFAIWWRHRARFGSQPSDSRITFGARVPYITTGIPSNPLIGSPLWRRYYLNTSYVNTHNIHQIFSVLQSKSFDLFEGYPSSIEFIAHLLAEADLRLTNFPRFIFTGSDQLFDSFAKSWLNVYSSKVSQTYGMAEFASNMSQCQYNVFHEDFECGHIEAVSIIDSLSKRLILTGWANPVMPFIRYDIGDTAIPFKGKCSCGRESSAFTSLSGRSEDFILTEDGRKITGMNQVIEYAVNVSQVQIVQTSCNSVVFKIVPTPEFISSNLDRMIREFNLRANYSLKCSYEICDQLITSDSGKYKAVVRDF